MGNLEDAKKSYSEAVNKAKTEHEKKPGDRQAKKAFDVARNEFFTFLSGLQEPAAATDVGEHSPTSPIPNQLLPINLNDAAPQRPLSAQRTHDASIALSNAIKPDFVEKRSSLSELGLVQTNTTEEKNAQVEYLFEKALSTLGSLELPNKPSFFLVYAHDNPDYGQAEASTSKYLIEKLSQIRVNLYSDQTPMGQTYSSSTEELKEDGKLEDILTNQLCLLPTRLRNDVKPVNKVVVCCSEVLGRYLEWSHYDDFYQELREAYLKDCEQQGSLAIREVVKKFSQEKKYKAGFHHVLTEIAFLQIRAEHWQDQHGIIPVSLTPNSYEHCLAHFIPATTVRMEDMPRLDAQTKAGEVYPNQSRHLVLFKLIERVLVYSDEARMFLNRFWQGYSTCIARLKRQSTLNELEFVELVDGIFDKIRTEQYRAQAQHLVQTRVLHKEIIQRLLPPHLSLADLRVALYQHYQRSNLSIQRVSGVKMSLADCYVNLAIVENQVQREQEKQELEKQASIFTRLPSSEQLEHTNPNKLIALEKLFEKQKLRDGSEGMPQRILIQGRAGIGKTTLCKKLVHEYYENQRWQDQFENVLWIPLRQLKTQELTHLQDFLRAKYFISHPNKDQVEGLAKALHGAKDQTLFILDGLDEVTELLHEDHPKHDFLALLLRQKQVLITSRPAGVNAAQCGALDLELETIGFSADNVQTYIENNASDADQAAAIQQFIHRTPLVQGLVNIPIQLDALCYSWDERPHHQDISMSMLYQAMANKLWRKDSVRLEKRGGKNSPLDASTLKTLAAARIEKIMAAEITYLSYLAFKGVENNKIEFSLEELDKYQSELEDQNSLGLSLPDDLVIDLKKTSYLHTADNEKPEEKRLYHFLHLTFQEFFAAKFLVKHLETYTNVEKASVQAYDVQKGLGVMPKRHEVEAFIATHKYNPRYEIVWWMVAGLLKGIPLEHFFTFLEQAPRDLIGMRHQQVMMGCLSEARNELSPETVNGLEKELMQWFHFGMKLNGYSALGEQRTFPEHLLLTLLNHPKSTKKQIIKTLGARSTLSESSVQALIGTLEYQGDHRTAVIDALTKQSMLSEAAVQALIGNLEYENQDVRNMAALVLRGQRMLSKAVEQILARALAHENGKVRSAAAWALEGQSTLSEEVVLALIDAYEDQDEKVRSTATLKLKSQSTLFAAAEFALQRDVRIAVVDALVGERRLSNVAVQTLIKASQHENGEIRTASAHALGGQHHPLSESAEQALIGALQDQNESEVVRYAAASVLEGQKTLSEAAIEALIGALKNEHFNLRVVAARALGCQGMLSDDAMLALIGTLGDQDEDGDIRITAAYALGSQSMLSEAAMLALSGTLQDRDEDGNVRVAAANALGGQSMLSEAAVQALIGVCQDQNEREDVKFAASSALGGQGTLPEAVIQTLISACHNHSDSIRAAAARALGGQGTLSKAVMQALIVALQDKYLHVRSAATQVFSGKSTLSEAAEVTLIDALQHGNSEVCIAASYKLLGKSTLSEAGVEALVSALQNQSWRVRYLVARALGSQNRLPESAVQTLIGALQNQSERKLVRSAAASALEKQSALPESAIRALINALQDEGSHIRSTAASALASQLESVYVMLPALREDQIQMLYSRTLLGRSCTHIAPLYIQENMLHFYTPAGPKSVLLGVEQIDKLTQAFTAVQADPSKFVIEGAIEE